MQVTEELKKAEANAHHMAYRRQDNSFLEESEKVLDVFRERDTYRNIKRLKNEIATLTPGGGKRSGSFSFTLALK